MAVLPQPERAAGLRQLQAFVPAAGTRYAKSRNFDFGPERRGNVSRLSPYIRHRLLLEQEVLAEALQAHSLNDASKFVQEIFWRAYFKGWLEHRPAVWADYRHGVASQLRALDNDSQLLDRYAAAVNANTGIDCFDAWASELVDTGYLHNHARMWFASIWVFTLGLPWHMGADFFYRHLIDGDPASNTLSWRWVSGLHTRGKTYLARVSNITSYTNGRFDPQGQLAIEAPPLSEARVFPLRELPEPTAVSGGRERFGLLVTEEDCHPESLPIVGQPAAVAGVVGATARSPLPIGQPAYDFAHGAIADAIQRATIHYQVDGVKLETDDWTGQLTDWATSLNLDAVVTAYAPVGPTAEKLEAVAGHLNRNGIRLGTLRRHYDSAAWPHARRGYFKLRERIPEILQAVDLLPEGASVSEAV